MTSVDDTPDAITCPTCGMATDECVTLRSDGLRLCALCHAAARAHVAELVRLDRASVVGMTARQLAQEVYGVPLAPTDEERLLEELDDVSQSRANLMRRAYKLNDTANNARLASGKTPPTLSGSHGSLRIDGAHRAELAALAVEAATCADCGATGHSDGRFVGGRPLCRDCRTSVERVEQRRTAEHARILKYTSAGHTLESLGRPDVRRALVATSPPTTGAAPPYSAEHGSPGPEPQIDRAAFRDAVLKLSPAYPSRYGLNKALSIELGVSTRTVDRCWKRYGDSHFSD